MVDFLDLMGNKLAKVGNNVKNRVLNVWDFMKPDGFEETPYIEPLQVNEDGNIDDLESKRLAVKQAHLAKPRTLAQHLFTGRTQETDMQNINPETNEVTLETVRTYQPSFFDNLTSGAKENFATGFASPNLTDNTGEFGKKSASYRLGEGIGTLGRFLESPLGRGLLVGGIVGASGGSGLEALGYGAGTTMGNQGNRMRDRAYRDDLIRSGKQAVMNSPEFKATNDPMARQAMLDDVENRVNGYRGYITDDVYRNMIDSQIAQENAGYRRMYYDNQARQDELLTNLKNEQFEYQKKQDAIKNAQEWTKLENDKNQKNNINFNQISSLRKEFTSLPAIKNANEIKRQFDNVTNTYNAYKSGRLRANAADQAMITTLNKILDPTSVVRESEFARTSAGQSLLARLEGYSQKIAKGGGGLTDAEREDLYIAMQEMYNANQEEANAYIQSYTDLAKRYNINPEDIMPRQYYNDLSLGNNAEVQQYPEGTIIKNKQGKRMIMRGGQWQAM